MELLHIRPAGFFIPHNPMNAMSIFMLIGLAAITLGCLCIYAAAAHQRWFATPWPRLPARAAAMVLLALGWLGLAHSLQRITAAFVFVTALMLVFAVLPYIGAFLHVRRNR
ncbi:MAG: hypothetical protein R3E55_07145 [Burkholderiaceae bacterium]|nr:hypothetical protein [Burkholderiaceae bacterium]